MRTVKSNAKRQDLGLTVPVATRQARKIVDAVMPGVAATVESKLSHDINNDVAIVVTMVTFPKGQDAGDLALALRALPGGLHLPSTIADSSIVIIRKVK